MGSDWQMGIQTPVLPAFLSGVLVAFFVRFGFFPTGSIIMIHRNYNYRVLIAFVVRFGSFANSPIIKSYYYSHPPYHFSISRLPSTHLSLIPSMPPSPSTRY